MYAYYYSIDCPKCSTSFCTKKIDVIENDTSAICPCCFTKINNIIPSIIPLHEDTEYIYSMDMDKYDQIKYIFVCPCCKNETHRYKNQIKKETVICNGEKSNILRFFCNICKDIMTTTEWKQLDIAVTDINIVNFCSFCGNRRYNQDYLFCSFCGKKYK